MQTDGIRGFLIRVRTATIFGMNRFPASQSNEFGTVEFEGMDPDAAIDSNLVSFFRLRSEITDFRRDPYARESP